MAVIRRDTALLAAALALAACGDPLEGTWADARGMTAYEFGDDGRARITVLGTSVAAEYRLDDDKVLVSSPQGTVVLTRREDRLYGPMGLELVRHSANNYQ